jgi:uroporphyrin-III C-methyltransferase/precorrin-2 dehydrogenase/sirohydrochlorin ferrochelatase
MSEVRKPEEAKRGQMARLSRLPVFLALDGKRALLAGGSPAAAWKAELLSAAGARIEVYAVEVSDELRQVAQDAPAGAIDHQARLVGG